MFYLNHFFKALSNFKVSGILFVVFTIALVSVTHNRKKVKKFFSVNNKSIARPYFNALISNDSNLSGIARKMRKLPGVKAVRVKKALEVTKELGTLQAELKSDVLESLAGINYSSVTIELSNAIQSRSQSLVREYLTRLVGSESVTISKIKKPKTIKQSKNSPSMLLHRWGDKYIILVLSFLWLASCISFAKYLKNYSFLIEKFQRKRKVDTKIFAFGLSFLSLSAYGINLYIYPKVGMYEIFYVLAVFAVSFFIFSSKVEFKKLI
mgnify:CR=1 FL=1